MMNDTKRYTEFKTLKAKIKQLEKAIEEIDKIVLNVSSGDVQTGLQMTAIYKIIKTLKGGK